MADEARAGPLIVGLGGTTKSGSSTERALRAAMQAIKAKGGRVQVFDGPFLAGLPIYDPENPVRNDTETLFVDAVRSASGLVIASPGYHGGVSGLIKNAIDLLEETSKDSRVYWDGLPVGLITTAYGYQATASTLASLRAIVHAMRGWPTPLGIAINSLSVKLDPDDYSCSDPGINVQFGLMADQVLRFARAMGGA